MEFISGKTCQWQCGCAATTKQGTVARSHVNNLRMCPVPSPRLLKSSCTVRMHGVEGKAVAVQLRRSHSLLAWFVLGCRCAPPEVIQMGLLRSPLEFGENVKRA